MPKNVVNPKWQKNQKNSCRIEQIALPNLKRSGFVFNNHDSQFLKGMNTNPEGLNQTKEKKNNS
ncbi:hypothetical protein CA265_04685 [Sphingobacteriaceae bacterium GW460-11-11-14-LB5]|nr:hypothetical protein CA265_04685 [Sphingobacteriaceae bacterium GW460-11-11-14-LB5]